MNLKKSTQVAIGGLSAAICLLLMFMTGLVPFSSYIFPTLAGMVLIAVSEENGLKTGFLVYAVTALLALMIVPDREAVVLFILLLGYYPMIKPILERIPKIFAYLAKLVLANGMIVVFYYVMMYIFGVPDLLSGWAVGIYAALGLVNFTFLMYDYLLSQVMSIYLKWFRPKILRKII